MAKPKFVLLLVIGIIVLFGAWLAAGYNGFVSANENVDSMWAQVETQYQRRADLIPNLVSTVKGAVEFESNTFKEITEARTKWQNASGRGEQIEAAGGMDSALSRLLVTVEGYPDLKATAAFRDLMAQLEGTENRISVARRDFNNAVQSYNVKVKRFPGMFLAKMFGFQVQEFFQSVEGSENAPDVEF